jgi:hypothetical protein
MARINRYGVLFLAASLCALSASAPVSAQTCGTQQSACNAYLAANQSTFLNMSNTCSGTETRLYARASTGQEAGACLGCAFTSGCLDDSFVPAGGAASNDQECEDLAATGGANAVDQCLAALSCDLGVSSTCPYTTGPVSPAWGSAVLRGPVVNAYCGPGVGTDACLSSGPSGACVAPISASFPANSSPSLVLSHLTDPAYGSGMADRLAACTIANCADACYASTTSAVPALGSSHAQSRTLFALMFSLLLVAAVFSMRRRGLRGSDTRSAS